MRRPLTLKIAEIFPSIHGEGLRQGNPTLFIRLSGCNLRCHFCDTKYAWEEGNVYTTAQVLDEVRKIRQHFPTSWICLTGGEPLLQDVGNLVRRLKKKGLRVQVETNGTFYAPLPVDFYSISPKPDEYLYKKEYKKKAKEVKLVVTKEMDIELIRKIRSDFPEKTPLFLQPQSNLKWSMRLSIQLMKQGVKAGLQNLRLSTQLHKIYGIR
jgi:organic radical activating enzyme